MNRPELLGATALRSAVFIGFGLATAPAAYAQVEVGVTEERNRVCAELPTQAERDRCLTSEVELESGQAVEEEGAAQAITVTGSRIRRPNLESSVPITSIGGEEFFQQGQTNVGDTLNDLPQLRSTFGQSNSGRFLGTAGLNLLDLRGLGTTRTLVLVNGRRHVGGDIRSSASSPDVNVIPNDLIERVDIVTGASSAIYGSDAIAGVVNFVLRRSFEGLQVRGHSGISDYGAGGHQYVSAMYGMNFGGDDRGNVTLHAEFSNQDRVFASDIPFLRQRDDFGIVDTDPAGTPNGSDGIPDRVFFRDFRTASNAIEGLIPIVQPVVGNKCGVGFTGVPFNCTFLVQPDGSLIPQTGSRFGTSIIGAIVGGNGNTGREGRVVSVFPDQQRYNFNLLGRFEISEAFEPFVEAKYARVDVQGQSSSPPFVQGVTFGDPRETIRLDNPFLAPATRTQITNLIRASGFRPSLVTRTPLTAADQTAINNGSFRFVIARSLLDLGVRDEVSKRETYRAVAGVRGTFFDDWSYEVSANYGRVNEETTVLGNINQQRFLLALDAGRNPATGQIECRSKFDPSARNPFANIPDNGGATTIAADIAACVPYNPFGVGVDNSAARNYIVQNTTATSFIDQKVLNGFVSGDTSGFFNLPGGPIGVAIGAEYRRDKIQYTQDPLVSGGFTFYNALPSFDPPARDVKEAFAEVRLPLLKDIPFIEELTVSGAGRVADYGGSIGTVFAYNGGVEWTPIRDIRFRGNYGRSVRAPGIRQTNDPQSQNFAPGFSDPCLPQNIGNNPNRPKNCAIVLGNNLNNPDFLTLPTYSLEFISGSNPLLTEETSDSITIGAVVQPRFIPGLSLTVDYYDIKVNDVIVGVGALQIVQTCVDLPSTDNPFCKLIQRNPGPGRGPKDEVPGQILQGTLLAASANFASLKRKGIDFEVAYRQALGETSRLDTKLIYTHVIQNSNFVNPVLPDFEDRILSELGDPQDEFQWNVDLKVDQVTFGYQMRYIGKQVTNNYEDFFPLKGATTPAGTPPNNADYSDIRFYPSVLYHDLRVNFEASRDFNFYAGVDNLTGRRPPLGLTGIGGGSGIYNIRGRQFFAGFKARF